MKLREHIDKLKYDSRLTDINLKTGKLTKEEQEKFLNSLPDLIDRTEKITMEDETSNGTYPANQFDQ